MLSVRWWENRLYPDPIASDATRTFAEVLNRHVREDHRVLDVGAGAGELSSYCLKGKCREIVGVDLDPRVTENPLLDRGIIADGEDLPFEDASFDMAFSIYVLEHVSEPSKLLSEIYRILKPGGMYLTITPNRNHYVSRIAMLTPEWFHCWFRKTGGVDHEDTFPTYYRLNTRKTLKNHFYRAGFDVEDLRAIEVKPQYLKFSVPTFLLGAFYERCVNAFDALECFRVNWIGAFRKPHK